MVCCQLFLKKTLDIQRILRHLDNKEAIIPEGIPNTVLRTTATELTSNLWVGLFKLVNFQAAGNANLTINLPRNMPVTRRANHFQ